MFKQNNQKNMFLFFLLITISLGTLLSILPHLLAKIHYGTFFWAADRDELELYLGTVAKSFHNGLLQLSDPMFLKNKPSIYPWLQLGFAPQLAKLLGLNLEHIGLLWRLFAGFSISLGWFILFSKALRLPSHIAFLISAILLCDSGLLHGQLFYMPAKNLIQIATLSNPSFLQSPNILGQWRIISPGLSLGFLLLYFYFSVQLIKDESLGNILGASLSFAALFYAYFYFWNFAGLGLCLSFLFLPKQRKTILKVLLLGTALGLPSIIQSAQLKKTSGSEWLERSDKFLAIPHLSELLIPKLSILIFLVCAFYLWKKSNIYKMFILHVSAGFILLNHQIFTGLQIENFHWNYALGPCLSIVFILAIWELTKWVNQKLKMNSKAISALGLLVLAFELGNAFLFRTIEFDSLRDAKEVRSSYIEFLKARPILREKTTENRSVIAGDPEFVRIAMVFANFSPIDSYAATLSPSISNHSVDERVALNSFLMGKDLNSFELEQRKFFSAYFWGPEARSEAKKEQKIQSRKLIFQELIKNPSQYLERYNVHYVVLPRNENDGISERLNLWNKTQLSEKFDLYSQK